MKALFTVLALITAAGPAFATKEPTRFVCGSPAGQSWLSAQFGGGRYADALAVLLFESEAKQLLLPSEQGLQINSMPLGGFLQMGSCKKGEGDLLVSCSNRTRDGSQAWSLLHYNFSKHELIAPDHEQSLQISRSLHESEFGFEVRKVGTDAHLHLEMVVDTAAERGKRIVIDRKLATLQKEWFNCRFE